MSEHNKTYLILYVIKFAEHMLLKIIFQSADSLLS